jgi:uncharacterized protein (UPF0335 family)
MNMDGSYHIDTALRGYTDRIVNLHEQRDELNGDIRLVYAEAKGAGFDVTTVRSMVRELRMDTDARNAMYQLHEEYRRALGMLHGTPLGDAAEEREARVMPMPAKPFAEQPLHEPKRRGRPRKDRTAEALERARSFLSGDDDILETHGSA